MSTPKVSDGKYLLVLSDLHTGSLVSLMPPRVYHDEGGEEETVHSQNKVQQYMWRKIWTPMRHHLTQLTDSGAQVDGLVLGDLVDGPNEKEYGAGLWTSSVDLQVDTAVQLLSSLPISNWHGVIGSAYHVGHGLNADAAVMKQLCGTHADERILELKVGSKVWNIYARHYISPTMLFNQATPILREMLWSTVHEKEYGPVDIMLFGHVHTFLEVKSGHKAAFICPGWKGRDGYLRTKSLRFNPHIGYMLFHFTDSDWTVEVQTAHIHPSMRLSI
jgi:hypothetical protein